MYYHSHVAGAPFVAPVFLLEHFAPSTRKACVPRRRFPIADAHFVMAFLRLHEITGGGKLLHRAREIGTDLLASSIKGYSGHCWGYPFDWETSAGVFRSDTPLITTTPYCFEAFLSLYDTTRDPEYLAVARSSAEFASKDIKDTKINNLSSSCSYSPRDDSKVMNANAYRAFHLAESYRRFGEELHKEQALKNIQFILDSQRPDGSWLYAAENQHNAFVDNFHTCFVLKNLFKANRTLGLLSVQQSIERGYRFYRENLFDRTGWPKPFAAVSRVQVVKVESYDLAEGISLGILLRHDIPDALEWAEHLVRLACNYMQMKDGHFVTRINRGGIRNTVAYHRWPQAQMFHALSQFYSVLAR
jgi:hypothetical protein